MFKLIGRIFTLIRGIFDEQVRELEWKKPEAVLDAAFEKKQNDLEKFYNAVADISSLQKQKKKSLQEKQKKLEQLELMILKASKNGDKENGIRLIMKKNKLQQFINSEFNEIVKKDRELLVAKQKLSEAQQEVEKFKNDRLTLISDIKMMQAQRNLKEINSTFFNNKDMEAYNKLKSNLDREKEKFSLINEMNDDELFINDMEYENAQEEFEKISNKSISYSKKMVDVIDLSEIKEEVL